MGANATPRSGAPLAETVYPADRRMAPAEADWRRHQGSQLLCLTAGLPIPRISQIHSEPMTSPSFGPLAAAACNSACTAFHELFSE